MMKKRVASLLLLPFLCGCNHQATTFRITDISKDTIFQAKTHQMNPTTIILTVTGHVNDTFMLQGFIKIPGGDVHEEIKQDCYHPTYNIRYSPFRATKGQLTISYRIP